MSRIFGAIPGIAEGHIFASRQELSYFGVHRPLQAGISGSEHEGADSIVLSGGYPDIDYGELIIYTGHGGRNQQSDQQVSDQLMRFGNLALAKNCVSGFPVRVIRGYGHRSPHSPKFGYRYDGLYRVERFWRDRDSGHIVYRFLLTKVIGTIDVSTAEPLDATGIHERGETYVVPTRISMTVLRIIRDTAEARHVKEELYKHRCQICGLRLETPGGAYAEAAHIRPLGTPHNGPDNRENILCLCPNHHVLFDYGAIGIQDDLSLLGVSGKLTVAKGHLIDLEHLHYHRVHFYYGI